MCTAGLDCHARAGTTTDSCRLVVFLQTQCVTTSNLDHVVLLELETRGSQHTPPQTGWSSHLLINCYMILHHHHCPEDPAARVMPGDGMEPLIPAADPGGRGPVDPGWKGGDYGEVDLQAIA